MWIQRPSRLLVFALLLCPLARAACEGPEYDQFDFWLGHWQVSAKGKIAGTNRISQDLSNCVLREHYTTASGFEGRSLNIYDASRQLWHQTWVDNSGLLLKLEGSWRNDAMILEGPGLSGKGEKRLHRITWTPNIDGSVRQHWQVSADGGQSWTSLFDGRYEKIAAEE
ncbi:hypothetical protein [Bowmanella dokdonensis]|uniref:DUF1579 domain-containing protein n=1 Tax=Bowmanella dokdonensis TaxID=751969 RepID=A0A939IRQ3_9ALTE|nr:hypothetical protein [Bowmanella dokdonensis]MBN7825736.1 hypothetical protein [Bowmanella dokdonensis]